MTWDAVNTVLMAAWVLLPGLAFLVLYGVFVKISGWGGRNALMLTAAIVALVAEELAMRAWGRWEHHDVFLTGVLLTAGFAIWERLIHLLRSTFLNHPDEQ